VLHKEQAHKSHKARRRSARGAARRCTAASWTPAAPDRTAKPQQVVELNDFKTSHPDRIRNGPAGKAGPRVLRGGWTAKRDHQDNDCRDPGALCFEESHQIPLRVNACRCRDFTSLTLLPMLYGFARDGQND